MSSVCSFHFLLSTSYRQALVIALNFAANTWVSCLMYIKDADQKIVKKAGVLAINKLVPHKVIKVHQYHKAQIKSLNNEHQSINARLQSTVQQQQAKVRQSNVQIEQLNTELQKQAAMVSKLQLDIQKLSVDKSQINQSLVNTRTQLANIEKNRLDQHVLEYAVSSGKPKAIEEINRRFAISLMKKFSTKYHLGMALDQFMLERVQLMTFYKEYSNTVLFNPFLRVAMQSDQLQPDSYFLVEEYIEQKKDYSILPFFYALLAYRGSYDELEAWYEKYGQANQSLSGFLGVLNWLVETGRQKIITSAEENALSLYLTLSQRAVPAEEVFGSQRIAVVGNAPSDLGKGKGAEIDAHDQVLRFNNFAHSEEYYADYGKNVQVWATAFQSTLPTEYEHIRYLLPSVNIYLQAITPFQTNQMVSLLQKGVRVVKMPSNKERLALSQSANVLFPSSGLCVINQIKNAGASEVNLYGFGLSGQEKNWEKRHYQGSRQEPFKGTWHCWDNEKSYFVQQGWLGNE